MTALVATLLLIAPPPSSTEGSILLQQSFQRQDGTTEYGSVYLPPGYSGDSSNTYPLLILLHGLGGHDTDWFRDGKLKALLDGAIVQGRLQPLIVVAPDGGDGYWTEWVSDAAARYSSLVEPEARLWADRNFRTDGRVAIAGVSMGGFGALSTALQHPGRFVAVLSFSGALFRQFPTSRSVYLQAFGYPGLRQSQFQFVNPIDLARHGRADLQKIWLDCGEDDRPKFTEGLRTMSSVLRARGVPHIAKLRKGGHQWKVWLRAIDDALPWLNAAYERARLRPVLPERLVSQRCVQRQPTVIDCEARRL